MVRCYYYSPKKLKGVIGLWKTDIFFLLNEIPANKNHYYRNKLIYLQCESADWFYMMRIFTDRNVLIVKPIQITQNNSFKPDFSLKHAFKN